MISYEPFYKVIFQVYINILLHKYTYKMVQLISAFRVFENRSFQESFGITFIKNIKNSIKKVFFFLLFF